MGRAKEEWMRREELEPMYEWIEENYGEDAGEEGSETWNEAGCAEGTIQIQWPTA